MHNEGKIEKETQILESTFYQTIFFLCWFYKYRFFNHEAFV
jgi:hypothetical protein